MQRPNLCLPLLADSVRQPVDGTIKPYTSMGRRLSEYGVALDDVGHNDVPSELIRPTTPDAALRTLGQRTPVGGVLSVEYALAKRMVTAALARFDRSLAKQVGTPASTASSAIGR
jgi:hypothetical protein